MLPLWKRHPGFSWSKIDACRTLDGASVTLKVSRFEKESIGSKDLFLKTNTRLCCKWVQIISRTWEGSILRRRTCSIRTLWSQWAMKRARIFFLGDCVVWMLGYQWVQWGLSLLSRSQGRQNIFSQKKNLCSDVFLKICSFILSK